MNYPYARRLLAGVAILIAAALSVIAVQYGSWLRSIASANDALAGGAAQQALAQYDRAITGPPGIPLAANPEGHRQALFNRARALYQLQRYDELTRFLESQAAANPQLPSDAEYQYWMGNVQFQRAIGQKEKQQVQAGLQQAAESFRRAVAEAPSDWDFKYNYELSMRLLESMLRGKDDEFERMKRGQMKILREDNEAKPEQMKQIAPEKRG